MLQAPQSSASASVTSRLEQRCFSTHPLGRRDQPSDSVFLLPKVNERRLGKRENASVVGLTGAAMLGAASAAGSVAATPWRCSNLNFVLRVCWLLSPIQLVLPLILPMDFSLPPTHLPPSQALWCLLPAACSTGKSRTKRSQRGGSWPLLPRWVR